VDIYAVKPEQQPEPPSSRRPTFSLIGGGDAVSIMSTVKFKRYDKIDSMPYFLLAKVFFS
jgi:hypothetical protein